MQKLEANPDAVGIFGFSFLEENAKMVKGISVEGKVPTYEDIADGSYKVARPLYIYAKKQHVGVIPGMKEFMAEFVSEKALGTDGYLGGKGLVTLPAADLEMVRAAATDLKVISAASLK